MGAFKEFYLNEFNKSDLDHKGNLKLFAVGDAIIADGKTQGILKYDSVKKMYKCADRQGIEKWYNKTQMNHREK